MDGFYVLIFLGLVAALVSYVKRTNQNKKILSFQIKTSVEYSDSLYETKKHPPSKSKLKMCERLGLTVTSDMGNRDVHFLIEEALKDPKIKRIYDEYQDEQNARIEKEDREEYGEKLYEEKIKWEKMCGSENHYSLIFKRGKSIISDIVEFERVWIDGDKKKFVKIGLLLPKRYKSKLDGDHLEWEKEVEIKPSQILFLEKTEGTVDMFDVQRYDCLLNELKSKELELT